MAGKTLDRSPERIKPVMWGQGSAFALLDCAGEFVVVVFGRDRGGVHAQYALSRQVGHSIAAEFGSPDAEPGAVPDRGGR